VPSPSSAFPQLQLSEQVKFVMAAEKISEDELGQMVNRAAITTHALGNRRYHGWVFKVSGDRVASMRLDLPPREVMVQATTSYVSHEECPDCEGWGCKLCGYSGNAVVTYVGRKNFDKPEICAKMYL
jgi:hypothetical protein